MIALVVALALADDPAPPPHDPPHSLLPDRAWDVTHLALDLAVDPVAGTVAGTATHTVVPLGRRSDWLRLDQVALDVSEVRINGDVVHGWTLGAESLHIPMPADGARFDVAVTYTAAPENGMHFRGPDRGDVAVEAWTQGEESDNRFWYPGWDFPNDKFTVDITLTASDAYVVAAIGVQSSVEPTEDGRKRWSFAMTRPVPNYLVAVALGDYTVVPVDGVVPVSLYLPRGVNVADGTAALAQVAPMIPWMSARFGVRYPYTLHRQVAVQRFLYGGMENPTVTVLNTRYLVPFGAPRDARAELVVAHELAHHWFGDLVTTYGFRDMWLNEGFATLVASDWQAQTRGADFAAVDVVENRDAGLGPGAMAPRPLSGGGDEKRRVYTKGSTVLRFARHYIGQAAFDAGVTAYLTDHADDFADSGDLRRALEAAGGRDLGWMWDQFVYGAITPTLSTSWSWDGGQLTVTLDPGDDDGWDYPLDVEVGVDGGVIRRTVWVAPGVSRVVLEVPTTPRFVAMDPDAVLPVKINATQSGAAWVAQASSPTPAARLLALREVPEQAPEEAVSVLLAEIGREDAGRVWRTRAVTALGEVGSAPATAALVGLTRDDVPELREAALDGLAASPTSPEVLSALRRALSDDDDLVAASALDALAQHSGADALPVARQRLTRARLWGRRVALGVIGEHGGRRDLSLVARALRVGEPARVQAASAAVALALRLDDDALTRDAVAAIAPLLDDADIAIRRVGVRALSQLPGAGPVLRAFAARTHVPDLATRARAGALASALVGTAEVDDSDAAPDTAEALRGLAERLDALEGRVERVEERR